MSKTNDGGAAFPTGLATPFGDGRLDIDGLTVRDWFAGQALAGHLSLVGITIEMDDYGPHGRVANWCYSVADAMLAARNEQPPE